MVRMKQAVYIFSSCDLAVARWAHYIFAHAIVCSGAIRFVAPVHLDYTFTSTSDTRLYARCLYTRVYHVRVNRPKVQFEGRMELLTCRV